MQMLSIKILDPNLLFIDNIPCCIGEINIGKFQETFEMPLEYWTIKDYEKQWADGIERIKKNTQSCLIAAIQNPQKSPLVNLWTMYKINNKIFIQNHLFFGKRFTKVLKNEMFNLETCYKFIIPRDVQADNQYPVSEWEIDLQEL